MDDTISNNPGSEGDILQLKLEVQELQAQVLDLRMKNESLQKELAQMRRENAQLKRMPLFVAAVVEVMENGEIYLRQQGNNQEYITQANEELHKALKPGTKVAVNNALSIVKIIGNIYDARVRIMELDESPDVTFEKIGGLKKEIEEVREAVEYPLTK
ncbi:MAG: peptidase, partial [Methanomicrobiales archaeon]|nr:peptidase [Methanomicrobiales archaeon]